MLKPDAVSHPAFSYSFVIDLLGGLPAAKDSEKHLDSGRIDEIEFHIMRYAMIIETGERNYSAYLPDLPGCVATSSTLEEVREHMRKAIELHLAGMREDGLPIPEPTTLTDYVEAA